MLHIDFLLAIRLHKKRTAAGLVEYSRCGLTDLDCKSSYLNAWIRLDAMPLGCWMVLANLHGHHLRHHVMSAGTTGVGRASRGAEYEEVSGSGANTWSVSSHGKIQESDL